MSRTSVAAASELVAPERPAVPVGEAQRPGGQGPVVPWSTDPQNIPMPRPCRSSPPAKQLSVEKHVAHAAGQACGVRFRTLGPRDARRVAAGELDVLLAGIAAHTHALATTLAQRLDVDGVAVADKQTGPLPPVRDEGAKVHDHKSLAMLAKAFASSACQQMLVKGFSMIQGTPQRWTAFAWRKSG